MKYHCDNKGVLTNVFSTTATGTAPYLQPDPDLVMEAKRLLEAIPLTILAERVKGHYNGKDQERKLDLNEIADSLATSFHPSPHSQFVPSIKPIAHPNDGARLLYEGSLPTNYIFLWLYYYIIKHWFPILSKRISGMREPFT